MPKQPLVARAPNAKISELYGYDPQAFQDDRLRETIVRKCPIRGTACDVSANRHQTALLDLSHRGIKEDERAAIGDLYGREPLPMGVCSCWARRQNETIAKPWILCPKRLLILDPPIPVIPREVAELIEISKGRIVRVWNEMKLRRRHPSSSQFFEYTFDYLLMELDSSGHPTGVPYVIEVMTSSTRGGGLTEHMVDVLLGRPQRNLSGFVKSVYTPNYRQVFERMLGQLIAKSEVAEKWGGRAIWVLQDVLLNYIEQTTAFDSSELEGSSEGNTFIEVYALDADNPDNRLRLKHVKGIRGRARTSQGIDLTAMLGLGYAPPLEDLTDILRRGYSRRQTAESKGSFDFEWGQEADPTRSRY